LAQPCCCCCGERVACQGQAWGEASGRVARCYGMDLRAWRFLYCKGYTWYAGVERGLEGSLSTWTEH
jgi:hypothetical protein